MSCYYDQGRCGNKRTSLRTSPTCDTIVSELLEPHGSCAGHTSVTDATDMSASCAPSSFPSPRLFFFDRVQ